MIYIENQCRKSSFGVVKSLCKYCVFISMLLNQHCNWFSNNIMKVWLTENLTIDLWVCLNHNRIVKMLSKLFNTTKTPIDLMKINYCVRMKIALSQKLMLSQDDILNESKSCISVIRIDTKSFRLIANFLLLKTLCECCARKLKLFTFKLKINV